MAAAKRGSVSSDTELLNRLLARVLKGFRPPEDITVSEWADKYRNLSRETSAEAGKWRTSRTPYLKEPMDAFTDPKVRRIVFKAPSQVGKSEFLNNAVGYVIDEDPSSILFVEPTITDAQEYSIMRIAPMIRDCPRLARRVAEPRARDGRNTTLQKTYPGGVLTLCGSTEAHALASKPIRYLFGDERDRWADSAGDEGDPFLLAAARQTTFYNSKAVEVSSPTKKGKSKIERAYAEGTMERWKTQCPHCGAYHEINFEDIRFTKHESVIAGEKTYSVSDIFYICPGCGCISDERTMKRQPARWEAENPSAYKLGIRSFSLKGWVSPWASWESIILAYVNAAGDSRKLQTVYNTKFGELFEDRGNLESEDSLLARREDYGTREDGTPVDLPDGVLALTCGVDTQDDRLEYEVVGHGHFGETWGIEKGEIMGRPDDDRVWLQLDDVLDRVYYFRDALGLKLLRTFVDEGGHFTQNVREQCQRRFSKNVFAIKGFGGQSVPYTSPPKKQRITINDRYVGECWQYQIGVDAGKQIIVDNLRVQTPGARYCHFPRRDDYGSAYFAGLLSETLVYRPQRKSPWVWEKIPGHERNEPFDIRNYALAAFRSRPPNLDAIDARLKDARTKKTRPVATAARRAAPPQNRQTNGVESYFDPW